MSVESPANGYGGYNAIETDKGVLLFSRTVKGFALFHDYMNLFMDNLYNPLCDNTYFNLHYIESTDPLLRDKCDIALKFPEKYLPLQFPIKEDCFTGTDVLKDSMDVKINGWEPTPSQIQRITDNVDGVHIPVRGDTFDISTLQEIASRVSYNRILLSGKMSEFRYEKEFLDLARKMENNAFGNETMHLLGYMKGLASDILRTAYPDIRQAQQPCLRKIDDSDIEHLSWENGTNRYNAIEEDKGVLLFSRTEEGKELFHQYLRKYMDNFYNPSCDNTYLNIHYLECDNGTLKGQSDLALRFPLLKQSEFPINNCFFADKNVLKYSAQKTRFSWKPNYVQVNKFGDFYCDGKYISIKGETHNISTLQEIADKKKDYSYFGIVNSIVGAGTYGMDYCKYDKELREVAILVQQFPDNHRQKVIDGLADDARAILKRDYPHIRQEREHPVLKFAIDQIPSKQKKGRGL